MNQTTKNPTLRKIKSRTIQNLQLLPTLLRNPPLPDAALDQEKQNLVNCASTAEPFGVPKPSPRAATLLNPRKKPKMGNRVPTPKTEVNQPSAPVRVNSESDNKLLEINLDSNGDGSGLTIWTALFISAITLIVYYIFQKIRKCRARAKLHKKQKEAREIRLDHVMMGPLVNDQHKRHNHGHHNRHSIHFDNDRFEEIVIQPAVPAVPAPPALPQIAPPVAPAPPAAAENAPPPTRPQEEAATEPNRKCM